jgi:L-ascorbate metabolism protein UlaG (beta-lactamase superfamily)
MTTARLDWYGCATFRLTLTDQVIFLDAYIDRVPAAPGTGLRAEDIERADWIVVGHSYFDHLWGAERIAKRAGATIIGSYETVRIMERAGVPLLRRDQGLRALKCDHAPSTSYHRRHIPFQHKSRVLPPACNYAWPREGLRP